MKHRLRALALAGLLCSVFLVAILHVIRDDLDPVARRLSEYAVGPYGWLMTTAFVGLGCGLLALAGSLRATATSNHLGRALSPLGFAAGAGMIVSGAFPTGESLISEAVHSRASGLATAAVIAVALAYSLPRVRQATPSRHDLMAAGLALGAALLGAISPIFHETRWTGLSQRLLWATVTVWLLLIVWAGPAQEDGASEGRSTASTDLDHEYR